MTSPAKITVVDPKERENAKSDFEIKVLPNLKGKNGLMIILAMTTKTAVQGSVEDIKKVTRTFESYNFAIWKVENPTKGRIPAVMEVAAIYSDYPKSLNKLFVYFTGHGGSNEEGHKYIVPDGEAGVSYIKEDIIMFFEPPPVSTLGPNVARVYLFDSCLSKKTRDMSTNVKDATFGDVRQPLIIAHATSMEEKSTGDFAEGGTWTYNLCNYIMEHPSFPFTYILDKVWDQVREATEGNRSVQGPHYLNYMGLLFLRDEYKENFYRDNTVEAAKSGSKVVHSGGGAAGDDGYDVSDIRKHYDDRPDMKFMKEALAGLKDIYAKEWRERFGRRLRGPTGAQVSYCVIPDHLIEIMYNHDFPFTWGIVLEALDHPTPIILSTGEKASFAVREYMYEKYIRKSKATQ